MTPTPIIQNAIPVRYNPRVVVKPCHPDRVPYLPNDILYLIAKALPQPKQVFNLALASKGVWHDLEGALYECEVTYEARLAHKYGGQSSASLEEHFSGRLRPADDWDDDYSSTDSYHDWSSGSYSDSDDDGVRERENGEDTLSIVECPREPICDSEHCDECNNGRIHIESRRFEFQMPLKDEQFNAVGSMTALRWAAIQGKSALHVAQKAIRAALVHQPSYIDGLNLMKRWYIPCLLYPGYTDRVSDHPPPLFLAAAHGNLELFQELIYAGSDLTLLLGRSILLDDRGYLMSSKIHRQCLTVGSLPRRKCTFEEMIHSWVLREDNFLACQGIGHVAIQFEQTAMLQILLQNGMDVELGSHPLLHSAALQGNMAAVEALLAHDPSLVHSRYQGCTPMHLVPFMEDKTGIDASEGQIRSMVSCLLEHGASLEAPAEEFDLRDYSLDGFTPLDTAVHRLRRLDYSRGRSGDEYRKTTALRAVSLFINMGASWLPLGSGDHDTASVSDDRPRGILSICLKSAVLLVENEYADDCNLWKTDFDSIRYRATRKLYAQTGKNLIIKAIEAMSRAADSDKDAIQEMLHDAFRRLVDEVDGKWQRADLVGWWALEALGHLLLSTGMKPCSTTIRAWKRILKRDYGAPEPDRKVKLIQDCEEIDGDKSEWAFLSEGITFAKTESPFHPRDHQHRK